MISITFSGEPVELIELFTSDGFLRAVAENLAQKASLSEAIMKNTAPKPEPIPEPTPEPAPVPDEPTPEAKPEPKISRAEMLHALQEYCVRMTYRYKDEDGFRAVELTSDLLLELTDGTANHTSKVDEKYFASVYNAAISDYIPEHYSHLRRNK